MPHGMLDPYFQRAKDRRLKAMRNWLYWKLIESRLINSADGLLFTCEEERNLARQTFRPYKPRREFVVGLGVEEPPALNDEIRSISFAGSENVTSDTILFLSRIHEKKGVDLLLKGVANVNNGNNAKAIRPLRLLVAGPGLETTYGKKIHALAEQMDGTSISFLNMLSGNPKWAAFYRADAFALPSHQENFGIAVVEALACGRPVLISNQVNIWREIEAAGAGLVASDTLQGTQALLNKWTSISVADRILMGQRARKLYEEKFAVSTAAQSLLQAIESAYEASQKKNSHVHAN
jgi:glycosyltransferase involved in cell wall biosynthesis